MNATYKVILTSVNESDLPVMHRWINDRELALFNNSYRPVHESQHAKWFKHIQNDQNTVLFGIRLVSGIPLDDEPALLIGSCQLTNIDSIHRFAELRIRIGERNAQNRGYGSQATKLLLDFAFRDLNLNKVYLRVFSTNQAALAMYQNLGFVREGIMRKMAHIDGHYVDIVIMGILREEHFQKV